MVLFPNTNPSNANVWPRSSQEPLLGTAMIVITRNKKTTFLAVCWAWLAGVVLSIVAWCAPALVAFILIGFAVTVGAALVIVAPAKCQRSLSTQLLRLFPAAIVQVRQTDSRRPNRDLSEI